MSVWHVTNHKLYSGDGTSNPVFIVGTEFAFDNYYSDPTNMTSWTDATHQSNRAAAGNSVMFWNAPYLGTPGATLTDAAQKIIDRFQEHYNVSESRKLKYFSFNMDFFADTGGSYPPALTGNHRGSHTYYGSGEMTNGSGHWKRIPRANEGADIDSDQYYYNSHLDFSDTNYWWPDGQQGNNVWHTNYLYIAS